MMIDPLETKEWIESLNAVVDNSGKKEHISSKTIN